MRLTSIHYLLTRGSPVGHWHLNESDILHFHHHG
ncbi:cupin domain-containing protein, partial [Streptomyces sp. CS7]|nr:cupin domain-containing protein [Streptomyces sp. CS-7]